MRSGGYDYNGNCVFSVSLYEEFSNKDECVKILNKYINKCIEKIKSRHTDEDKIHTIEYFQKNLGNYYDDKESFVQLIDGIAFSLIRDTRREGWRHRIEFRTYDETDLELKPLSSVMFVILVSEDIDENEKYYCDHKHDQKIRNKGGDSCMMYSFVCGSRIYEEEKKQVEPKQVPTKEKKQVPTSTSTQSHTHTEPTQSMVHKLLVKKGLLKH